MQFTTSKRRQTPVVIIISLIDVLIVVLIFLMVTTTFKQQAAVKLALPESSQTNRAGASESLLSVTIPKQGPLYLAKNPITYDKLQAAFVAAVRANPEYDDRRPGRHRRRRRAIVESPGRRASRRHQVGRHRNGRSPRECRCCQITVSRLS